MTTNEAALKLQELNRQQRQIVYAMTKQQAQQEQPKPRKRYRINKPMCFFWLNALGIIAFVASNVYAKLSVM